MVQAWRQNQQSLEQVRDALRIPAKLVGELSAAVRDAHQKSTGQSFEALSASLWAAPFVMLPKAFAQGELPETPQAFVPVPDAEGTLIARVSAVVAMGALGMETVSYGSENDGELFVNLVVFPGEGRIADKSKGAMRGHTDAVTFPFRGQLDVSNPDIAPSPDFVCLSGLRNPDGVRTTVMPISDVLAGLSAEHIDELKKQQFDIRSQKTFIPGMNLILGKEHGVDEGEILLDVGGETWVRYSHSSILVDEDEQPAAAEANAAFAAACLQHCTSVVVEPGDILLVNNRLALHGRSDVGGEPGGESRWILRTYGLDTTGLTKGQRYSKPAYMLFP
ncbi:TauD/TfdA family dioxygenase [Burkholderia sp. A9]|uniref:TauD/TfdA family dioxygenase n=1 Tax=Burkholderia sp. A9 TaxID=1365108 RepID=UPI000693B31C|nr:TauD/TfdA family dioxygenase [Burkholderia sp. A9]